jgi:hypothetical protein
MTATQTKGGVNTNVKNATLKKLLKEKVIMTKKYKCTVVETYTRTIEIPDDVDIADIDKDLVYDFSLPQDIEETVVEIRNDSVVDLIYKEDGFFEEYKEKADAN